MSFEPQAKSLLLSHDRSTQKVPPIVLALRALASGSSGNAYLLQTGRTRLLFEAGLPLPTLHRCLEAEEVAPGSLSAVLISHEHRDHCLSARELAEDYGVPVFGNVEMLRAAGLIELPGAGIIDMDRPMLIGDVEVSCFPVSHDAVRPVGFRVEVQDRVIVLATDLGRATPELAEAVAEADLVVLEANHDPDMLARSRYPYHLRRRVASPTGHLSNGQAAAILVDHVKSEHVDVWLAHLSRENNTPTLATRTVRRALTAAGLGAVSVAVALRDRPSARWTGAARPRQLRLFSGLETI
jgi:phosphoribosyl 1,2-cyclic phosphodiesterase